MSKTSTFEQFLSTQSVQIPIAEFIINLLLAAVLAFLLQKLYIHYGTALSNRHKFSRNFILMTMVTMLVISIVKSSLALSLGLVGALSIVRFRAAIKEPEELTYLFLSIAIGLGLGADQRVITLVAFVIISLIIILNKKQLKFNDNQNLYLTVSSINSSKELLDKINEVLTQSCASVFLKRYDKSKDGLEAVFVIELSNFNELKTVQAAIEELDDSLRVTFLDNQGNI